MTPTLTRSLFRRRYSPLLALLLLGACQDLRPRLGYPWLESASLELFHETLRVTLADQRAQVDARLHFVAHRRTSARELAFPEDRRDGPLEHFVVELEGQPLQANRNAHRLLQGYLPLEHVNAWYAFVLPELRAGQRVMLRVRYAQPLTSTPGGPSFRYLLRTGAYWRGPIGSLDAEVLLGPHRARQATLDQRQATRQPGKLTWRLVRVEPRTDLLVELERLDLGGS